MGKQAKLGRVGRRRLTLRVDELLAQRLYEYAARINEPPAKVVERLLEGHFQPRWDELEEMARRDKALWAQLQEQRPSS